MTAPGRNGACPATRRSRPGLEPQIRDHPTTSDQNETSAATAPFMVPLVVALFFVWGFATVLVDPLIPKLKALFTLDYTEVMLTQFSFFIAYFAVSLPAGMLIARIGYVRGIVVGLLLMALGCSLFSPAASLGVFPGFLLALFVMASGITTLQVAANPLIALLGPPHGAHSRLTFAQAFNSLGTAIGPYIGALFILAGGAAPLGADAPPAALAAKRSAEAHAIEGPFLAIAGGLVVLALIFFLARRQRVGAAAQAAAGRKDLALFVQPRLLCGALSIFAYVGAEVSIGSLMINYLSDSRTIGADLVTAGKLLTFYWGGAMVGRFIGAFVLTRIEAGTVLAACALGAAALASISALSAGMLAAATVLAIGLCNSIMFPTIFTLAIEGLGHDTPRGSGLLCLAIVGGAIIPLLTGSAADHLGLSFALFVPALCYLWIAAYGGLTRFGIVDGEETASGAAS
jgi:MFS transporter, FHS family, L-fucose permease